MLTDHHNEQRIEAALAFLEAYHSHVDVLLDLIVTGDETWVKYKNCETKLWSMEWEHTSSNKISRKCLQTLSARKIMNSRTLSTEKIFLTSRLFSRDIAPSDIYLFQKIKTWLATQHFDNDEVFQLRVTEWLKSQSAELYDTGNSKLVHRCDKCMDFKSCYRRPKDVTSHPARTDVLEHLALFVA
ncbi:hypothetical protein J6590_086992 [Homalodisca vitripennis]|nr:hypothetical protein J6590_086992 [Homalodisca vitripennis]